MVTITNNKIIIEIETGVPHADFENIHRGLLQMAKYALQEQDIVPKYDFRQFVFDLLDSMVITEMQLRKGFPNE